MLLPPKLRVMQEISNKMLIKLQLTEGPKRCNNRKFETSTALDASLDTKLSITSQFDWRQSYRLHKIFKQYYINIFNTCYIYIAIEFSFVMNNNASK